jgi:hypothetical protein
MTEGISPSLEKALYATSYVYLVIMLSGVGEYLVSRPVTIPQSHGETPDSPPTRPLSLLTL